MLSVHARWPRWGLWSLLRLTTLSAIFLNSSASTAAGFAALAPLARSHAVGGLPAHFAFGLQAGDGNNTLEGWMPASGVPWDYAWTYLPSMSWKNWGANGTYPLAYAQRADAHGYTPVFDFYEQTGGGESAALTALNDPNTMSAYFADFALLMKRLGSGVYEGVHGFGKPVVVHIEPDLSGFVEQSLSSGTCDGLSFCRSTDVDPSQFTAAVASTGDPAAAAFPDTYQGYNWTLLHLRDLYAPNVIMAVNVSPWATRTDTGSNTDPATDRYGLGQQAGAFAAASGFAGHTPSGVAPYQLVFEDPADHDSGSGKNPWWDRTNTVFPNFHGWEDYLRGIHDATGASLIPWQVPLGNQYFASEDNSTGHTQDNRPEYVFSHVAELANVGVIGILFGQGPGNSQYNDQRQDGITNPSPQCTSAGMGGGRICPNHTSSVADDDGGYLRMAGGAYYASGAYPLSGNTPQPSHTSTPTAVPSVTPSAVPSVTPSAVPSTTPTAVPSVTPSAVPSVTPSVTPTKIPPVTTTAGRTPSVTPTAGRTPSVTPTAGRTPSVTPTAVNTLTPTPASATPTPVSATPTPTTQRVPTPSATPAVTPPASAALVVGPLRLAASSVNRGDTLVGAVVLTNTGGTPLTLPNIVIAARPPGGTNQGGPYDDLGGTGAVTLASGQSTTVTEARLFGPSDPAGAWYSFVTYQTPDGAWHDAPAAVSFTVHPAAPTETSTSTPSAAADAAPAPLLTGTAGVTISSPLQLSAPTVANGGVLTATVVLHNAGTTSVMLRNSVIAGRPPGGTHDGGPYDDFGGTGAITLAPGASLTVWESRTFRPGVDPTGTWYAFATYQTQDGAWHDAPTTVSFSVS